MDVHLFHFSKIIDQHFTIFDQYINYCCQLDTKPCHNISDLRRRNAKSKFKGDIFELFCKRYLEIYSKEYSLVWLYRNIPNDIRSLLNLTVQDFGIDIIASRHDGGFDAIQCKFRKRNNHKKTSVSWKDLSTFYAHASTSGPYKKHIVMTSADYIRHIGKRTQKDKTIAYRSFCKLKLSDWILICKLSKKEKTVEKTVEKKIKEQISKVDIDMIRKKRLERFSFNNS